MDDNENLPAVPEENIRDAKGRFVKGAVANPKGRGKGTRNWIVEQKLAFEAALRDYVASPTNARRFLDAMDNIIRIAAGDGGVEDKDSVAAMKILTDKFMASTADRDDGPKEGPPPVRIVIENHTTEPVKPRIVIEGEYSHAEPIEGTARRDGSGESR